MADFDQGIPLDSAGAAEPGTAQLAQARGEPIGQISSVNSVAHVTHTDGEAEDLSVGGRIYINDIIRTDPDGEVGITFIDGTQFSLGGGAELRIDKLIYDPTGSDSSMALDMLQGAFVFVTGGIAGAPGEGMTVGTPAGSIGVRGTSVGGHYASGPEGWIIALFKDSDGHVGKVVVYNGRGEVVLDQVFQSTTLYSLDSPPSNPVILEKSQIERLFGGPLEQLPDIQLQNDLLDQRGELDIQTAANINGHGGPNHGSHFYTPTGFGSADFGLNELTLLATVLDPTQLGYNAFIAAQNPNDKQFDPLSFRLTLEGGNLPENSPDGTVVGFVSGIVGGPPHATYRYSLIDQEGEQTLQLFAARTVAAALAEPAPAFAIDPNTGVITVNNSALLDFETTPGFRLVIHAENNLGRSIDMPFQVTLENVNDSPPVIDPAGPVDLPENSAAGTIVATVTATDADGSGNPIEFSIIPASNPNGWFAINPQTGEISLTAAGAASPLLDQESGLRSIALQIAATDGSNAATPIDVEINISDVLEPVWSISGTSEVAEGGSATYFVSYTGAVLSPGQTLTVEVAPDSGTAISGTDFVGDHAILTFTGGETIQSVVVTTIDDTIIEGTENFSVSIINPSIGEIATATDSALLVDNAEPLVWQITGNGTGSEGGVAVYTVSYSGAALADGISTTVTISSQSGSATEGQDFDGVDQILTFTGGGATSQTITVALLADSTVEDPENFTVSLSSDRGDAGEASTTTVIDDPSQPIAWSIAGGDAVDEGNASIYTVSYAGGPILPGAVATVTIASSPGSAQDSQDFTGLTTTLTFTGGSSSSQTVAIAASADTIIEGTEDFSVAIAGVSAGSVANGAVTTEIIDRTSGPFWTIHSDSAVTEGEEATYIISYGGVQLDAGQTVLVTVDTASGSANDPADFDGQHVVLTFSAGGGTSQTLAIQTAGDTIAEGTENYTLTITPSRGEAGQDGVVTSIIDDDDSDRLLVGSNGNNLGPGTAQVSSTAPYAGLILQGGTGQDVLIGDSGGAVREPGGLLYEDQNAVTLLDKSGSVVDSDNFQLAKSIVLSLAQEYATYAHDAFAAGQDVTIKFTVIPFSSSSERAITVTAAELADLVETSPGSGVWQFASLVSSINEIAPGGGTDFQDALTAARNQLLADNGHPISADYAPLTGFDGNNRLFFISDGQPVQQGPTFQNYDAPLRGNGLDYWRGVWTALGVQASAIGIGLSPSADELGNLQRVDNSAGAQIVTNAGQVSFHLEPGFHPDMVVSDPVGADSLNGGNGQDIIFGDVINTDALGSSAVPGEGYDALLDQLQLDLGHAPSDQEMLGYIRSHIEGLALDNDPRGEADRIDAGEGNDMVLAQGGNDTILGGLGADLLDGGTGNDRIVADAVAGSADGSLDTLIGGMGSDILVGAEGEADHFQWKAGHHGAEGSSGLQGVAGTTLSETPGQILLTSSLGDPRNIHYYSFEVTGTDTEAVTIDLKSLTGNIDTQIYLFRDANGNGLVGGNGSDPLISSNDDDSGRYGIASDGSSNSDDSFIVQGQLTPGKYILAIGDNSLTETEARSNDGTNGNSDNESGNGSYQLTITGEHVSLTGGHGLAQGSDDDWDTVQGFTIGGAPGNRDILDFHDLLSGAPHTGSGATAADLSAYFEVSFSDGNTVLSVDPNGAAGPSGAGFDPQLHVVLQGVSQASWGGSQDEAQVLSTLIANGQLAT